MDHQPPFTLTPAILNLCTQIAERVGRLTVFEEQITSQDSHHATPQVIKLLAVLQNSNDHRGMSRDEIMVKLLLSDRKSFTERYLKPAIQNNLLALTTPDKPRSPLQRYKLTSAGLALFSSKKANNL